jgi:hypothetical protein
MGSTLSSRSSRNEPPLVVSLAVIVTTFASKRGRRAGSPFGGMTLVKAW